jgi:cystathionine beta-lyase/cystathionine gamma-synthase
LVRLNIGLEDIDDLKADFDQALLAMRQFSEAGLNNA